MVPLCVYVPTYSRLKVLHTAGEEEVSIRRCLRLCTCMGTREYTYTQRGFTREGGTTAGDRRTVERLGLLLWFYRDDCVSSECQHQLFIIRTYVAVEHQTARHNARVIRKHAPWDELPIYFSLKQGGPGLHTTKMMCGVFGNVSSRHFDT